MASKHARRPAEMQLTSNTSGYPAEVTVCTDPDGRDHALAVVKASFEIARDGAVRLADEQAPLVLADVHHGDPATTSIQRE